MPRRPDSRDLPLLVLVAGLVLAQESPGVKAEIVYEWTDASGITHFSQNPPDQDPVTVDIIEFDALKPPPPGTQDYYSVVNQARRMEADRRKREQENLDRRLAIRKARQADRNESDSYRADTSYIPVYSWYGYKRPHGAGYFHRKPGHGYRPGYKPGGGKPVYPAPYRTMRGKQYPRGVINTGR